MIPIPPHEVCELPTRHLGKRLWLFPALDSTNTLALALAGDPAHDGLVILAQEQTSGRGQYGRTWTAPAGSSVLLSVLLFPPPALRRPALLTAWAAVAVCETVAESARLEARIKWPNDVLVQDRKVCGILIEQRTTGQPDSPLATVVGIGLNVRQSADFFVQANLPLAGSLASLSGQDLGTRSVARRLIGQLDAGYARLCAGDFDALESSWKERLGIVGQQVIVETATERRAGRLLDLTWDAVFLEEAGALARLAPESVKQMKEA